jgi:two-component system, chemotaxis family, chemotaxis protein CheY
MALSTNPDRLAPVQDLSGVCILVLDDDPNMRSLISGALSRCGCRDILRSGVPRDSLRLFSSKQIDLVICDWMMEPMSGLQFLRELRRPERRLTVPVIMLTANTEPLDIALAQKFDISGWLVKPIALPKLIERIGVVLSLSAKPMVSDKQLAAEVENHAVLYRAKLVEDLRDLDEALTAMRQTDLDPTFSWAVAKERAPSWAQIDHILHDIKGQAGSFGYDLVTSVAALGQALSRPMSGDIHLIHHHHEEVHRCVSALAQAMRMVLQNEIRGDGGAVGARLMDKLRGFTGQASAKLIASTGTPR